MGRMGKNALNEVERNLHAVQGQFVADLETVVDRTAEDWDPEFDPAYRYGKEAAGIVKALFDSVEFQNLLRQVALTGWKQGRVDQRQHSSAPDPYTHGDEYVKVVDNLFR